MTVRVSELSVDELRVIIQEVIRHILAELLRDSDEGLELRKDFQDELDNSLNMVQAGGKLLPADSVAADLGLEW